MKDDAAIARFIQSRVVELANAAIASKGAFSMSIGSGTTVAPLIELAGEVDFTRVHLFFGNERTEGEAAGKCFDGAAQFVEACGVGHVYRVPSLAAADAAVQYEATVRALPSSVVGACERSGLPSLDLVLLGSGADGHCASLYPGSAQVVCSPGCGQCYLPAEGKGGITLSLDAIGSARNVLLSAGKAAQANIPTRTRTRTRTRTLTLALSLTPTTLSLALTLTLTHALTPTPTLTPTRWADRHGGGAGAVCARLGAGP